MSKSETKAPEFKVLSDRDHILQRPAMYIGQTVPTKRDMWILNEDNHFVYEEVEYVPGLDKILSEILDNCLDVAIESDFTKIHTISIKVDEKSFSCQDDGPGIPVKVFEDDKKKRSCVELAWTQPRAGTSFNEDRRGPSANGIGSTASNIFSKVFKGISDDGKLRQKIVCKDNLSKIKAGEFEPSSGKSGVYVYLEPDLERFGLSEITYAHQNLIRQRLINLSVLFPQLKFKFNGQTIHVSRKQFASLFSENFCISQSEKAFAIVFQNPYDEFRFFSYVNGLNAIRGGTHVEYVINEIAGRIRDKLSKRFKTIRPGDVKSKLGLILFMSDVPNLQFDAQTKESISNSVSEIKAFLSDKIDFDKLAKDVMKSDGIMEQIEETFKLKEEVKSRIALKHSTKNLRISVDKYIKPIGNEYKYLFSTEGLSARGGLSAALGRNGYGFYANRGVGINAYDSKMSDIVKNQEFKDLMAIIGLDISNPKPQELNIGKFVIATDQDADGNHIADMFLGWFTKFAPWMFEERMVARLQTPLAIVFKDKAMTQIVEMFFNLDKFNEFEKTHDMSKYTAQYYKGLGTYTKDLFVKIFDSNGGVDNFIQTFKLDENGRIYVDDWLNGSKADVRKQHIKNFSFNINSI